MFHVLTCCRIFKLSQKSQQPLVGKTSWGNFKCIYNFYLPSLPATKCWPLQVGLTIFQASKLLLPSTIEIQKLAMFVIWIWPSLRNIAFAEEKKKDTHVCGHSPNSCQAHCIPAWPYLPIPATTFANDMGAPTPWLFIFLWSEKFIPSNVKLFNIINHARIFVWNLRWTSFNWYIILFPLAVRFKWFHA